MRKHRKLASTRSRRLGLRRSLTLSWTQWRLKRLIRRQRLAQRRLLLLQQAVDSQLLYLKELSQRQLQRQHRLQEMQESREYREQQLLPPSPQPPSMRQLMEETL